jgi:hypothetical protein
MERIGIRGLSCLFIIGVLLSCFGCSSMSDVVRAKEAGREGTAQDYPVTSEEAWTIAKAVFRHFDREHFSQAIRAGGGDRQEGRAAAAHSS